MAHHIHEFRARTNWTGARLGPTSDYKSYSREFEIAIEGRPLLTGTADKAFLGDGLHHNPEDLLIASLSSCHLLSYLAVCAYKGIRVTAYHDEAWAKMEIADKRMCFTEALLKPVVTIDRDSGIAMAKELHHDAHDQCFIANSVNFPVRVEPTIRIEA